MTPLPFTLAFLKILMAARWSAILFASFFGTPHPYDSRTTSITRPIYFDRACSGKEGAASFLR
jgi:hypothetical protein